MNTSWRVVGAIGVRSVALLVLAEAVSEFFSAISPTDDGLGTGLTVMFALACAASTWGMLDGFRHGPVRLCLTWITTGVVVSLSTTLISHLRYGEWSWSLLADDLSSGLLFWAGLVFVPAIAFGIGQSITGSGTHGHAPDVRVGS